MESSSSASEIDYSDHFDQMIAVGKQIHSELTQIREALTSSAESHQAQMQAIEKIATRAANATQGLYIFPLPDDQGLSRAAMINALKQSGQLENVTNEMEGA